MHIIQKHIIEMTLPSSEDGFVWQEKIQRLSEEKITPALEELFDKLDIKDVTIEIDQISIELDYADADAFAKTFIESVRAALKKEIGNRIREKIQDEPAPPKSPQRFRSREIRLFFHFLENGTLPWWSDVKSIDELQEIILQSLSKTTRNDIAYIRNWLSETFRSESALRRFYWQFSETFRNRFLYFFNETHRQISGFVQGVVSDIVQHPGLFSIPSEEITEHINAIVLGQIFSDNYLNINILLEKILRTINPERIFRRTESALEQQAIVNRISAIIEARSRQYPGISGQLDIELLKEIIQSIPETNRRFPSPKTP
jgi:hypothetical protein